MEDKDLFIIQFSNIVVVDDLDIQEAKSWSVMVLAWLSRKIPASALEESKYHTCPSSVGGCHRTSGL